jgi:hypothetical protein
MWQPESRLPGINIVAEELFGGCALSQLTGGPQDLS